MPKSHRLPSLYRLEVGGGCGPHSVWVASSSLREIWSSVVSQSGSRHQSPPQSAWRVSLSLLSWAEVRWQVWPWCFSSPVWLCPACPAASQPSATWCPRPTRSPAGRRTRNSWRRWRALSWPLTGGKLRDNIRIKTRRGNIWVDISIFLFWSSVGMLEIFFSVTKFWLELVQLESLNMRTKYFIKLQRVWCSHNARKFESSIKEREAN